MMGREKGRGGRVRVSQCVGWVSVREGKVLVVISLSYLCLFLVLMNSSIAFFCNDLCSFLSCVLCFVTSCTQFNHACFAVITSTLFRRLASFIDKNAHTHTIAQQYHTLSGTYI